MANKLTTYQITDNETGHTYQLEGPEGASDEDLTSALQEHLAGGQTSEPPSPYPEQTQAPVSAPQGNVQMQNEGSVTPNSDLQTLAVNTAGAKDDRELSEGNKAALLSMYDNPAMSYEQINEAAKKFQTSDGMTALGIGGGPEGLSKYRADRAAGKEAGDVGYQSFAADLPKAGPTVSAVDETHGVQGKLVSLVQRGFQDAAQYGMPGWAARSYNDWMDTGKDQLKQRFPGLTDDEYEELQENAVAYVQKSAREANMEVTKDDPMVPWLIGQLAGSAGPEDFLPMIKGEKLAQRIATAGAVNAGSDVAWQNVDMAGGVQDQYNPEQTLAAAGLGMGLHGLAEGLGHLAKPGERVEAPAAEVQPGLPEGTITAPTARKNSKAYKEQLSSAQDQVQAHVTELTKDWKNPPVGEIHQSFKRLDGIDNNALGVTTPDGKMLLNTEKILETSAKTGYSPEEITTAVTYHEGLGHHGLAQKFGLELDAQMREFYEKGATSFRNKVDDWLEKNKTQGWDGDRIALASEEVLAKMSESGQIPATMMDKITNKIKDYGRKMGADLKYSEREIRSILALAHKATVDGSPNGIHGTQLKYQSVYHGSGADFDEFDHSKMGSGEGAQVYGWGTYLTENEGIAKGYRDRIGGEVASWNGVEGDFSNARDNMRRSVRQKFSALEVSNHVADEAFTYITTSGHFLDQYKEADASGKKRIEKDTAERMTSGIIEDIEGLSEAPYEERKKVFDDTMAILQPVVSHIYENFKLRKKGKLYKVEVPDDAKWVHWDFQAEPEVNEAFKKLGVKVDNAPTREQYQELHAKRDELYKLEDEFNLLTNDLVQKYGQDPEYGTHRPDHTHMTPDEKLNYWAAQKEVSVLQDEYEELEHAIETASDKSTGEGLYRQLSRKLGSDKKASQALAKEGITGIKYLDGNSRRRGEGSSNYVVFDDKTPKITNKYMREYKPKGEAEEEASIYRAYKQNKAALDNYEPVIRTWSEGKEAARERGLTAKQISKAKSVGELDKRLFMYDETAQKTDEKLSALHEKMDTGTFSMADKAKYLETVFSYNEMTARIFEDQAEIGRALNAMKALSYTKNKLGKLNEILKDIGGKDLEHLADEETFQAFAEQIKYLMATGNKKGALATARAVVKPYWWEYILSLRHNMMLSGIGTHAKNLKDITAVILKELEEKTTAAALGAGRNVLNKAGANLQDGLSGQELLAHTYGLVKAATDANTYINTYQAFMQGQGNRAINPKTELQHARIPGLSKVSDTLHAVDTLFRAFHMNANLYAIGVREAREAGFRGAAALSEGTNMALAPSLKHMREAKEATEQALLIDTPSWLVSKLEGVKSIRPNMSGGAQAGAFAANMLFPFFRVTDRLLFQQLRRIPLIAFADKNTRADWRAGGARRDVALARQLYGGALLMYYWMQAGEGNVEGQAPSGDRGQKRAALEAGGYMPNSVKEDGEYKDASAVNLSYSPFDTQNLVAANVASIRHAYDKKTMDGSGVALALLTAAKTIGTLIESNSFADNIETYTKPFKEDNSESEGAAASAALFNGLVTSTVVPAGLRQINQTLVDPVKRDMTGDKSFEDRVKGNFMDAIPGLSDNLPAKHDVYGDEMQRGRTLSGLNNHQTIKTDEVSQELQKLEKTTDKAVVTGAPSSFKDESARTTENPEGKVELNAEGKQEWQRVQGYYLTAAMKQIIPSEEWKQASTEERIAIVKEVKSDAYQATKQYMLPLLGLTPEEDEPDQEDEDDAAYQ